MPRKLLSLLILCAAAGGAQADETRQYTVLFQGKTSGAQTTTVGPDGRITVDFQYRDNGRGPTVREDIVLARDDTPVSYRLAGTSTYGAPIDESFSRDHGTARWRSSADHGEAPVTAPTAYYPVGESSAEITALIARALWRQPSHRLAAAPAGELGIERLAETTVHDGRRAQHIVLYAITGLDFSPTYVWLTRDAPQRLFALIFPGWFQIIDSAWQAQAMTVETAQVAAQGAQLQALVTRVAHHVPDPIVIRNARVFDSEHATLGPARDVYVYHGRIAALYEPGTPARDAATVIDAGGRVLMPALFDLHDHENYWHGVQQIAAGVTTVRDMGNDNATLTDQIDRIDSGRAPGPRIVPAGFIEGESPFASRSGFVASSLDDVKRAIDWYAQRGYPQIKLYNSFRREWVTDTARYAHERGLRVSGHVPAFMRAEEVVAMGYDELQHMNQVFLNFLVGPKDDTRTLARFYLVAENGHALDLDSKRVRDFVALLKQHGTVIDSTLATFSFMTYRQGEVNPPFAPVIDHLPATVQRLLHTNSLDVTDANVARYRASYDKMVEFAGRLYRAGVPLVAGTDDIAGFTLQGELELYVKAGIPPAEVLRIATWNGAKYTRTLDRLGSVTPGKLADLILVDGDPTVNMADIRKIGLVMKEGTIYYPSEVYPAIGVKPFTEPVKYSGAAAP